MNFSLLMLTKGILSSNNMVQKIHIRRVSLNIKLSNLKVRAEQLFSESLVLGTLLANGLQESFPIQEICFPLFNHERFLHVKEVDVLDKMQGT